MRIPLDYYRILGVPTQATEGQLSQAYHDRALQLPRREFSDAAINARKQLLDESYEVLSNPEKRSEYNAQLSTQNIESSSPQAVDLPLTSTNEDPEKLNSQAYELDIPKHLLVGALLILQELGEYEQVLKIGEPYLDSRNNISFEKGVFGDPQLVRADIVLTMALACMELGREQWQQGQYENAAVSGQIGQKLLLKEGLFPSVRGEIQADLYKLRPYQILELLALPPSQSVERHKGLQLLREMLQERGGIDGTGNDQSGLSVDDFLRFIQQLRSYLTAEEQQELFEAEARRPSAVATYLAVYALIGRGFAQRQPNLIKRAKEMLLRLGKRQDVYLEQAVCALLLGQTHEASHLLDQSQEHEPITFIREHSQGSPDLLPGLCLYGERWLQKEVFPHFRDLAQVRASLKAYFADEQLQAELDSLPVESPPSQDEWAVLEPPTVAGIGVARVPEQNQYSLENSAGNGSQESAVAYSNAQNEQSLSSPTPPTVAQTTSEAGFFPEAEKASLSSATATHASQESLALVPVKPPRRQRRNRQVNAPLGEPIQGSPAEASPKKMPFATAASFKYLRLFLFALASLIGILVALWSLTQLFRAISAPAVDPEQPRVELNRPPVEIPPLEAPPLTAAGPLNAATAQQVVERWLSTKANALGPNHEIDQLNEILVDPMLSRWRRDAIATQQNNAHWQYEHEVNVLSVNTSPENPNQATVEAQVSESAQFYQAGQLAQSPSYNENLRVRYDLVRPNEQWQIRNWEVIN